MTVKELKEAISKIDPEHDDFDIKIEIDFEDYRSAYSIYSVHLDCLSKDLIIDQYKIQYSSNMLPYVIDLWKTKDV